ncbi:WhiB family transcription factor [Gordonia phage Emianna]|uniref:WhiB family transcription factor n=3 Tax=Foxborovirus TaxID=2948710 RepID=A0A385UE47_9CAUD|nr:transcriptional regulator WhiB-like [Gordonia phage NatB6]YP_010098329.1 transcriptional regulator WhiB-like [Gordonia phage Foxboro]YP_010098961.1 transcriptional regulator WhiB-like [Gordonia phage Emianna]AYD84345.1 WhiB family transcription factor [Gordonia phage Kurt]AXH50353.1 WhiB family transcription factor [Gordonia phage NatB6]AYB69175.1 WhiB family transcription factor [Gordonia phage Foxboro]AYD83458.1 WhiB family transcription factor [Gordonia phage Emianna]
MTIGRTRASRIESLSVTGRRIARSLAEIDPKIFAVYNVDANPAMEFEVPDLPDRFRHWRNEPKPCDLQTEDYIPDDEDDPFGVPPVTPARTTRRACIEECRFLDICSRDALGAAQAIARHQGSAGRLCGTWAGVTFTGREAKRQYITKLNTLTDQIKSGGRIPWEPSSSNPTILPSSNGSKPSELESCGLS